MLALSIRQPYAELILRGDKTIEYRSRPTRIIGRRFAIYAARTWAGFPPHLMQDTDGKSWIPACAGMTGKADTHSPRRIAVLSEAPRVERESPNHPLTQSALPTGVLVGSAVIRDCIYKDGWWQWHLTKVRRYQRPRRLASGTRPQPVWFRAA